MLSLNSHLKLSIKICNFFAVREFVMTYHHLQGSTCTACFYSEKYALSCTCIHDDDPIFIHQKPKHIGNYRIAKVFT